MKSFQGVSVRKRDAESKCVEQHDRGGVRRGRAIVGERILLHNHTTGC